MIRLIALSLLACLAIVAQPSAALTDRDASTPASCPPITGLEAISDDKRFVILGEFHGTQEIPSFASALACHLSEDRPLVLSLEIPSERQADIDAYLVSPGDDAAKRELLKGLFWQARLADGRSSEAMLKLLDDTRRLIASGRRISVRASVIDAGPLNQDLSELLMAADWVRAATLPTDVRVLALVGRAHAGRSSRRGFRPAASHLPDDQSLRFEVLETGGAYWACLRSGCGEQPLEAQSSPAAAGFYPATGTDFDGTFNVGREMTASHPAITKQN